MVLEDNRMLVELLASKALPTVDYMEIPIGGGHSEYIPNTVVW